MVDYTPIRISLTHRIMGSLPSLKWSNRRSGGEEVFPLLYVILSSAVGFSSAFVAILEEVSCELFVDN